MMRAVRGANQEKQLKPLKTGELSRELRALADPARARLLQGFFKTGPGQYAEGDVFLGLTVPAIRKLVKRTVLKAPEDALRLIASKYHEERLAGLLLWVRAFAEGDGSMRQRILDLYLKSTAFVNNWDLVDLTAPNILGESLLQKPATLLNKMAQSPLLWERRMAIVATHAMIRRGEFETCLGLCRALLRDTEDLMHKACGWMLREVGKRDRSALKTFLQLHAHEMPRTMLRYSIEHFNSGERKKWMGRKAQLSIASI